MRPVFIATPMCSTQLRLHEGESAWLPLPTLVPTLAPGNRWRPKRCSQSGPSNGFQNLWGSRLLLLIHIRISVSANAL